MENPTTSPKFQIVRISGKNVMTILGTCSDKETAEVWVSGYIAGGGITRKGKSEAAPRVEIWTVG